LEKKMFKTCSPFARVTELHDDYGQKLTPCAGLMYRILLRAMPAGKPQEFELKRFCNKANYSLKWAKSALRELCDMELVEIIRTFSGHGYKLIAHHADRPKTSPPVHETSPTVHKTSQKPASNADSTAVLYRENIERTTNRPTHHPVSTDEREKSVIGSSTTPAIVIETEPPIEPEPEVQAEVEATIAAAGFRLNATLKAIVRSTQAQIVLQAIAATQQYLHNLQRQSQPLRRQPEALLVAAIRQAWEPRQRENNTSSLPPDFNEWLKAAQIAKLVSNSCAQADVTGHPPGVLCLLTVSGDWTPYDEMRRLYSLAEVKDLAERQQKSVVFTPSPRLAVGATLAAATTAAN
jgi:hypothetical protein